MTDMSHDDTQSITPDRRKRCSNLSHEEIEIMLERAAEAGAKKALTKIGLGEENSHEYIKTLKSLVDLLDEAKATAWRTFVKAVTIGFISIIIVGIAVKMKIFGQQI